jgi:glycerol-3-phosphate dehydrogenase (NAD(P)+)
MILTALSPQSRNQSFGVDLGKGTSLEEILAHKQNLTEGFHTVSGAVRLAEKHKVHMPITFAMNEFLNKRSLNMETLIHQLFESAEKEKAA